jgi:hypothetical protein
MAAGHPILLALFRIPGVAEAVLERGALRLRIGRLFSWQDVLDPVQRALARF